MPQVFKLGSYWVYFWTNENKPLEPVHVHVSKGSPVANGTKIWITQAGKCYLCNNNSKIPPHTLRNIMRMIEARSEEIEQKWLDYFGEIRYFYYETILPGSQKKRRLPLSNFLNHFLNSDEMLMRQQQAFHNQVLLTF